MKGKSPSFAGKLLVSHPLQKEESFSETVILLHAHSEKEGAMGVILNRPCRRTLAQSQSDFSEGPLAGLPLHLGGPVSTNRMALGGWKFPARGPASIRYGISREEAAELAKEGLYQLFAFVGYAGWSPGQLENELRLNAWLVCPFSREVAHLEERDFWKTLLAIHRPDWRLVCDSPSSPDLN